MGFFCKKTKKHLSRNIFSLLVSYGITVVLEVLLQNWPELLVTITIQEKKRFVISDNFAT